MAAKKNGKQGNSSTPYNFQGLKYLFTLAFLVFLVLASETRRSQFLCLCNSIIYPAPFSVQEAIREKYVNETATQVTREIPTVWKTQQSVNRTLLPIRRIYLLGERNSGTNYIETILLKAFPRYKRPSAARDKKMPFSSHIPALGFKHMMFRQHELNATELEDIANSAKDGLWLLVVRNPCDWADAMYRTPWHMCPPFNPSRCPGKFIGINKYAVKNLTRAEFFQVRWQDFSDNFSYKNVFALRTYKLRLYAQIMSVVPPERVKIARMNDVEVSPERFINDLAMQFGLTSPPRRKREAPSEKQHPTLCLKKEEQELASASLDWELEALFGFSPLDCHTCAKKSS